MPVAQIGPPIYWSTTEPEDLEGSGFFGDLERKIKHTAQDVGHHFADRDNRHNAGAVLAAASPAMGPAAGPVAATGAALMASGQGKKAGRAAKKVGKAVTNKANTRKAMDIAQILANKFGGEQTKQNVATAAALERVIQGGGLKLAGTGDYEVRPAVMPPGAFGRTKLMQAAKAAR